jgi:hypothetical protein
VKRSSGRIRIRVRRLPKARMGGKTYKVYGRAWLWASEKATKPTPTIELHNQQTSRCLLNTAIHECLHLLWTDASEGKVTRAAGRIADVLWRLNYRRVAS